MNALTLPQGQLLLAYSPRTLRDIVKPCMTRKQARLALQDAGWQFIGGGSFATVFLSPDGDRVAKVTKPDRGAEATYEISKRYEGNPHFARYYDRLTLDDSGIVYEVEPLETLDGYSHYDDLKDEQEGSPAYDEAYAALEHLWHEGDFGNDEHWRNAMIRPSGEVVFTDAIYHSDDLMNATVSAGQAEDGDWDDSFRHGSCHWADVGFDTDTDEDGDDFDHDWESPVHFNL